MAARIRWRGLCEAFGRSTGLLNRVAMAKIAAGGGFCELHTMPRPMSQPSNDVTVYLVLNDYRTGLAYVETATNEADRETVIRNFLSGQYSNALRVVAFNAAEGWPRDVSENRDTHR